MTFQTGWTKALIIAGEEQSCGDREREWATELLLSSSVPICCEIYFLNLINSPSLPHTTYFSWSKYKVERGCVAAKVGVGIGCDKDSPLFCTTCKFSSPSRVVKKSGGSLPLRDS